MPGVFQVRLYLLRISCLKFNHCWFDNDFLFIFRESKDTISGYLANKRFAFPNTGIKVACINISAAVSQNFYSLKQNIESFLGKECLDLGIWPSSATFVQIYIMSAYEWILMISSPKLWVWFSLETKYKTIHIFIIKLHIGCLVYHPLRF